MRLRVVFEESLVGLICQAFFHLCRTEAAADYEVVFRKAPPAKAAGPGLAPTDGPDSPGRTADSIRFRLKEGFDLSFNPEEKRALCSYPEHAFEAERLTGGDYDSFCHNAFNQELLPPGSPGVPAAVFWLLENLGVFRLHAAYVRFRGQDVILIGRGKVGKTTLALNIAMNGGTIYCDDVVFFRAGSAGGIEVHPFPKVLSITDRTRELLPGLNIPEGVRDRISQKHRLPVGAIFPGTRMGSGAPRFALFPSILPAAATAPEAEAISAYQALMTCLDGVILLPPVSPANRRLQIELIEKLCSQVRPFAFRHGLDMAGNFRLLRSVLGEGPAGPPI